MVCSHVARAMDIDPAHAAMAVSTPSQASQVEEHPTRKAVPRQLDFTTMYGDPVASPDKPARLSQPNLYGTPIVCVQYVLWQFFHFLHHLLIRMRNLGSTSPVFLILTCC